MPKRKTLQAEIQQSYYLLREMAMRHEPDCMISFFALPYGYPCALISDELHIPLVVAIRGNDVGRFVHDPGRLPLLQYIFRHAAVVQVLATDLSRLVKFVAPEVRDVRVIYNGIDPEPIDCRARGRASAPERFVVGSVGIFKPKRGLEVLLRAFQKHNAPNWQLLLVGEFLKTNSKLEMFLTGDDVRARCEMTGVLPREEAIEKLFDMAVFVTMALSDGCPNAVLEAMVARRCIVSTKVAAMADLIVNEQNGLLLDYPDDDRLGRTLGRLSRDPALCKRLGDSARDTVQRLFPPYEETAWLDLLSDILTEK